MAGKLILEMVPNTPIKSSKKKTQNLRHEGQTHYCVIDSPLGKLLLAGTSKELTVLSFQNGKHSIKPAASWVYNEASFKKTIQELRDYFSGKRQSFTIKTAPKGTTFQQKVWRALTTIPFGKTVSYGEIARSIGKPQASRAVGAANGKNPVSIIVPCHRVIGSTGKLVGYGGGLSNKEKLLRLEQSFPRKKRESRAEHPA